MSAAGGALAELTTGSVAFTSVQLFGGVSFRQPVTLTMSTFCRAGAVCSSRSTTSIFMARMIPLMVRPAHHERRFSVRGRRRRNARPEPVVPRQARDDCEPRRTVKGRVLRSLSLAACVLMMPGRANAHDLERTQVLLSVARDGSFVLDVANDPSWLKLRLERFPGSFADRVVLWVDGHEVRPTSVEYLPPTGADGDRSLGTYRLRGRLPSDARTLRWYYGLVIDPYPLMVRTAAG